MATGFERLFAGLLVATGVVIMGCDDKPRHQAEGPRVEAQANLKVQPAGGSSVSKPNVSEPVEPKSQTTPGTDATPRRWKPGDPVKVRPDLRRSDQTGPTEPKTEERK